MFSLTSTVASAKLTSKVRPHPFAPAPRTRFRSRDLERERFPTQKARYNEWIFSFFFFGGWDQFFLGTKDKKVDYTRGKILPWGRRRRRRRRRERGGVFFYPVATKTRTHRARKCSRDSMRPSTRGRRRRVFVVVSFFRTREGGGCVDFEISFRKGGKKRSRIFSSISFDVQSNRTRADRGASLFPSPMNGRTNEQVNFKTSRTATKARAGFSVNAAAVRLPLCIYLIASSRIVLDRVHEELSKKKKRKFS